MMMMMMNNFIVCKFNIYKNLPNEEPVLRDVLEVRLATRSLEA